MPPIKGLMDAMVPARAAGADDSWATTHRGPSASTGLYYLYPPAGAKALT
jgi:hypothetical protein